MDFLLRRRIENEEDIQYTTSAAEAGLLFIEQVHILSIHFIFFCGVVWCGVVWCGVEYGVLCCVVL